MIVRVAFPIPVDQLFDYRVPPDLESGAAVGSRVKAPFGRRSLHGVVVELPEVGARAELKEILSFEQPSPLIPPDVMSLARFAASHYACSLGEALAVCGPPGPQPKRVVSFHPYEDDTAEAPRPPRLTLDQEKAMDMIHEESSKDEPGVVVLHGVTGSGKTEVYLRAAEEALAKGKAVLYLLPEIALATRVGKALGPRFGGTLAVLHSGLPRGERHTAYGRVLRGEARMVVGARSAVFAPVQNLGLVIVDEESEPAYKQEETPRYNARDLAVVRAREAKALVILGSATPSLESLANVERARYRKALLPSRIDGRPMPLVRLVDMRKHLGKASFLSFHLREAIRERLAKKEQVILLLNRRGFASFIACADCGEPVRCSRCAVSLVLHRKPENLRCHYCGLARALPKACDACGGKSLKPLGAGTQRVEEEVKEVFPEIRMARVDMDEAARRNAVEKSMRAFARGELDLLAGTQMIAKGLDFPGVTLVGVVSADAALFFPDFRAEERVHQLLTQVSGRAGRGDRPGEVLIQTLNPEHPVLRAVERGETRTFHGTLLHSRKQLGYPPFTRLGRVVLESLKEEEASASSAAFAKAAWKKDAGLEVLGPAPAPLSKIRNRYRFHVLLKGKTYGALHEAILRGRKALDASRSLTIRVDVDPQNML